MELISGQKLKMSQIFKDGKVIAVTPIKVADISVFNEGELVKITGVTRGIGFQGVVKRHGFHGGPRSHGQKHRLRAPGSIGSTAPQRVVPGRRMAGQMGGTRVTTKNLTIAGVDKEKNQLLIKGSVPGNRHGLLEVYGK